MSKRRLIIAPLLLLTGVAMAQNWVDAPSTVKAGGHKFFDRHGIVLTGAHLALTGLDAWRTQYNVCRPSWGHCGDPSQAREFNPFLRPFVQSGSERMLATGFVLGAASEIATAYMLHKRGHHKLERIVQWVNIGESAEGFAYSSRSWGQ
jgi:hypothetical protein